MTSAAHNIFERHKIITGILISFLGIFVLVCLTEMALRMLWGLGNPVIYDSSPIYGYRPLPGKVYNRFWGAQIRFNNLGLRADEDWDKNKSNKILFLGDSVTFGGSYINNNELFSFLAVKDFPGWKSGNAGVNGWGVENIHGLIVESEFTPAKIYVTTVPEGDFMRGLSRMHGTPFFNVTPRYALMELWLYFSWRQNERRYDHWQNYATKDGVKMVIEKAINKLKAMDIFLKQNNFDHFIFISPSKKQIFDAEARDDLIFNLMTQYGLSPVYILDKLKGRNLSPENMYHDSIHLDKKGHKIWGEIIKEEIKKSKFLGG